MWGMCWLWIAVVSAEPAPLPLPTPVQAPWQRPYRRLTAVQAISGGMVALSGIGTGISLASRTGSLEFLGTLWGTTLVATPVLLASTYGSRRILMREGLHVGAGFGALGWSLYGFSVFLDGVGVATLIGNAGTDVEGIGYIVCALGMAFQGGAALAAVGQIAMNSATAADLRDVDAYRTRSVTVTLAPSLTTRGGSLALVGRW